jgi:hypothetical protein
MNMSAKCVKKGCSRFGPETSTAILYVNRWSAGNDRYNCPACGELMQTVRTISQSIKGSASLKTIPRRVTARPTGTTSTKHKVGKKKITKIKIMVLGPKLGVTPVDKKATPRKTGPRKRI